ncbi:MAG TPA: MBL fold metallo-hydrolase [Clostridia bacterium]|nr:MBL fold metallo-hydrolase [Clostridia bacterium]
MKFYVLANDIVQKRGFLAEHGLSIFIEHENGNILFDTGQTDVFLHNAKALGVELNSVDSIVLSHGHYDHCGGLTYLPPLKKNTKVYVQESAFDQKLAQNTDGSFRDIGIQWSENERNNIKKNIVYQNGSVKLNDTFSLHGQIPTARNQNEVSKGLFVVKNGETIHDLMTDEQALVFKTEKGLVVFLGCSHPGVTNILDFILKKYPNNKIDTLVAGMHLNNVEDDRLQSTMHYIEDLGVRKIYPLHCTGIVSISKMKSFFGSKCCILYAGDSIEI